MTRRYALALSVVLLPAALDAAPFDFPAPVRDTARELDALASYAMPVGPFANGTMPVRPAEGQVLQESYQLEGAGATTLQLLSPLRQQLAAQGFDILFECDSFACGGFDFRFGTRVMAEPDMHVDLGDFRYLAAVRGPEVMSLIVSRSSAAGFVQVTHVTPPDKQAVAVSLSSKSPAAAADGADAPVSAAHPLDRLRTGESVVLTGLDFASGAAVLGEGAEAALAGLAEWLKANPDARVALRGYTDASGPLAANIALSAARAEAVMAALVKAHGVAASRLEAEGLGPENPIADNATAAGRQTNRRVEVSLTSTPGAP